MGRKIEGEVQFWRCGWNGNLKDLGGSIGKRVPGSPRKEEAENLENFEKEVKGYAMWKRGSVQ